MGTGRSPRIPYPFQGFLGPTVFHSTQYLSAIERLRDRRIRVAVVGASQSSIEIILDLLRRPNVEQVTALHRGIGFRLKDTSPYSRRCSSRNSSTTSTRCPARPSTVCGKNFGRSTTRHATRTSSTSSSLCSASTS